MRDKRIRRVIANTSPHKFAFYLGNPADYDDLLVGQIIGDSFGIGAMVEITAGNRRIVFGDGANMRFCEDLNKTPAKHQLLLEFADSTALICSVQMYAPIFAFLAGNFDNKYY